MTLNELVIFHMKAFADLYTAIDETTKTNAKVAALMNYFSIVNEKDAIWCVALLIGKKPKRTIKTAELKSWCIELAGISEWLFEESYNVVGDLAETITLILPPSSQRKDFTLHQTMETLMNLDKAEDLQKRMFVQNTWEQLSTSERFVFNKLITGSFRVGVSQQLVIKALAKQYHLEENVVSHRLTGKWNPATITLKELLFADNANDDHSKPYPFYLAYQLEQLPEELGDINEWQIERKYDGIRGQIIIRDKQLFVWSRGEELITEKFPEFNVLVSLLPEGTVIDGEILPMKNGKPLPFHVMQTRIGRKNLTKKILADAPLMMMCYDLLELNGIDQRNEKMENRRKQLEKLLKDAALNNSQLPLVISPVLECKDWEETKKERSRSREYLCEGLMLKRKDSIYEVGRRKGNWWKWKVDALTVDGVLIYAQKGHGRRANLYTDYTFAIWDGEELVPFTKAYSGLTDKEILQVDNWIKKNTIDKFGPVRSVKAEQVFEIAFEGIQPSPRHKSGIALRFPRIARWRTDKSPNEANTKEDLLQLIESLKVR
ncbi:MAG: ATP-dependent ligase [Bacteroidetes bacterium]|jgi:DNA ligase-1|nr:ATP-dependent ligase [Bacteroidota bacterium]